MKRIERCATCGGEVTYDVVQADPLGTRDPITNALPEPVVKLAPCGHTGPQSSATLWWDVPEIDDDRLRDLVDATLRRCALTAAGDTVLIERYVLVLLCATIEREVYGE